MRAVFINWWRELDSNQRVFRSGFTVHRLQPLGHLSAYYIKANLVNSEGFEPPRLSSQIYSLVPSTTRPTVHILHKANLVERVGFEPTCLSSQIYSLVPSAARPSLHIHYDKTNLVERVGFEPTCLSSQIYSLVPSTTRPSLHS